MVDGNPQGEWTAERVKDRLRSRHPATQTMGIRRIPGPWTCIEEWSGIDLLAFCATGASSPMCGIAYARVGYEVKVSRADYRSELSKPHKRAAARASCHEFYFAVPRGLLRDDELPGAEGQPQLGERSLYVPDDVGLVVVDGRGCKVVKKSPVIQDPDPIFGGLRGDGWGSDLHALIRWVSARPDPRHDGLVERARELSRQLRNGDHGALGDELRDERAA